MASFPEEKRTEVQLPTGKLLRIHLLFYPSPREGPPFVLLHGLGLCAVTWRKLSPILANLGPVYALDLPGFGLSDKPTDIDYSIPGQGSLLAQILSSLNLDGVILGGQSRGGAISLATAIQHPSKVKGLILMGSPAYYQPVPWMIRLARLPGVPLLIMPFAKFWVQLGFLGAVAHPHPLDLEAIQASSQALSTWAGARAYQLACQALRPEDAYLFSPRYSQITCPTLIIHGAKDRIVPPWVAQRLSQHLPYAELHLLPHVGHIPHVEDQDKVTQLITDWYQRNFDPPHQKKGERYSL